MTKQEETELRNVLVGDMSIPCSTISYGSQNTGSPYLPAASRLMKTIPAGDDAVPGDETTCHGSDAGSHPSARRLQAAASVVRCGQDPQRQYCPVALFKAPGA